MSSFLKIIGVSLCFLIFTFLPASSNVEIITQGLPPTRGFHMSIGTLPNSNIIFISTGEIDAYDDVWVNPDTEINWYYYVDSSGMRLLGAECYTTAYPMCPRLNLNVSENLAHFRTKTKLVRGVPVNGSVMFNFGDSSYKVPVSKILPYLWDESWIGHLWGYNMNGSLIFFPKVIIEIRGANVKYQGCSIENGSASVMYLDQQYNITYYVKASWKKSKIKSEVIDQHRLLHLLKKPLYIFFYNGTFKAFKAGRIDFKYSTVLATTNNSTSVFVNPSFYYSNMISPFVSANTTYPHAEGTSVASHRQDKHEFWLLAVIIFAVAVICLLCRNRKNI